MRRPERVDIPQARLSAVGTVEPAEEVIEGAVLHHDDDHVLDARGLRRDQRRPRCRRKDASRAADCDGGSQGGRRSQKLTTTHTVGRDAVARLAKPVLLHGAPHAEDVTAR
jgi:hypothetical protein